MSERLHLNTHWSGVFCWVCLQQVFPCHIRQHRKRLRIAVLANAAKNAAPHRVQLIKYNIWVVIGAMVFQFDLIFHIIIFTDFYAA